MPNVLNVPILFSKCESKIIKKKNVIPARVVKWPAVAILCHPAKIAG
jgi:hypothetical protein